MASKTWFITGTSKGFGREWAVAALERGDKVAATARDVKSLDDLAERFGDAVLPMALDVTDRQQAFEVVRRAGDHFDGIDVVVNNAGFGQFGFVEELSEADLRSQMETNLFGALWVTQAALPILRRRRRGHIIQVTSIGGITAFPMIGAYHASKWALEGISQSLAQEVAEFGIKVTIVEPAAYSTDWGGPSAKHAEPIGDYDEVRAGFQEKRKQRGSAPGDPRATRDAILQIVDAAEPPLRVFFGDGPLALATADYESRLATWRQWEPLSVAAQGKR